MNSKLVSNNLYKRNRLSLRSLAQSSLKICLELPRKMLLKKLYQVLSRLQEVLEYLLMFSKVIYQHTEFKMLKKMHR